MGRSLPNEVSYNYKSIRFGDGMFVGDWVGDGGVAALEGMASFPDGAEGGGFGIAKSFAKRW